MLLQDRKGRERERRSVDKIEVKVNVNIRSAPFESLVSGFFSLTNSLLRSLLALVNNETAKAIDGRDDKRSIID